MGTEAHLIGVGNSHPLGLHVVEHARESILAEGRQATPVGHHPPLELEILLGRDGPPGCPHVQRKSLVAQDVIEVDAVRPHLAMRQQVEPQVGVGDARGRGLVVVDEGDHQFPPQALAQVGHHVDQHVERPDVGVVTPVSQVRRQGATHIDELTAGDLDVSGLAVPIGLVDQEVGDTRVLSECIDGREPGVAQVALIVHVGDTDRTGSGCLVTRLGLDLANDALCVFHGLNTDY